MQKLVMTFDQDWAPDWAVEACVSMCLDANVPFTFFATNESPILRAIKAESSSELGVHPNFLPNSSHGTGTKEVLSAMAALVPEARSMRTHSLVQSSRIFAEVVNYTEIVNDVSLLIPFGSDLRASTTHYGTRSLIRLPYSWEDDEAMFRERWDWRLSSWPGDSAGYHTFDFHPIHVALNSANMTNYEALKEHLRGRPLFEAKPDEVLKFRYEGKGTATYFAELLQHRGATWMTVKDACAQGS